MKSQPRLDFVHPDDRDATVCAGQRLARGEAVRGFENRYRCKDGSYRWLSWNSFPLPAEGAIFAVVRDITERKQAEMERQRFVMLADSSSEFIGMCDLELQPIYVNPAGIRMVGLPDMAAACRVKVQDYFFPEDQRFITEEFFPRVLREGHGDVEIRLRHFQTGAPIWMFYYLFSVRNASGTPIGWATVSRDITDRKKAEEELRRTNRALRTISDCNQALIRAADEQELLDTICRIVVDVGGYRMAWVGYAEQDHAKRVRPMAWAGCEDGTSRRRTSPGTTPSRGAGPQVPPSGRAGPPSAITGCPTRSSHPGESRRSSGVTSRRSRCRFLTAGEPLAP
ncbi:MAG TPA: hypothetical protein DCX07_09620 [Phycisphaerales bacterium]|nr:hypothetical protein [Phycisphaerales bacterium]